MLADCQQGLWQGCGSGLEWSGLNSPTDDNLTIKQLYAALYEHRPRAVSRVVWAYFYGEPGEIVKYLMCLCSILIYCAGRREREEEDEGEAAPESESFDIDLHNEMGLRAADGVGQQVVPFSRVTPSLTSPTSLQQLQLCIVRLDHFDVLPFYSCLAWSAGLSRRGEGDWAGGRGVSLVHLHLLCCCMPCLVAIKMLLSY